MGISSSIWNAGCNRELILDITARSDEQTISRAKEIALSQFSMRAETRKDKYIQDNWFCKL